MILFIKKLFKSLLGFVFKLMCWACLLWVLIIGHSHLNEINYQNNQNNTEIHSRFHVLVQAKSDNLDNLEPIFLIPLNFFNQNPNNYQLVNYEAQTANHGDKFGKLKQISPDIFELYADLDTSIVWQRYRITPNNQVEPIAFREEINPFSFMILFVLSFPIFGILRFLLKKIYVYVRRCRLVLF